VQRVLNGRQGLRDREPLERYRAVRERTVREREQLESR
jgi:hypothetical protein